MTIEKKKFEVTYHTDEKFHAESTQTFLHVVEAYEYEDGIEAFNALNLGTLWSIDEISMDTSSFTSSHAANGFLAAMNKHDLGSIEEKGKYNFVVHYPSFH